MTAPSKPDSAALQAARELRDTTADQIKRVRADAIAAMAQERHPECTAVEAVNAFSAELTFELAPLLDSSEALAKAETEACARQKPIVDAAARRTLQIAKRIADIEQVIKYSKHVSSDSHRAELFHSGRSTVQMNELAAPRDCSALLAEQAELHIESDALEKFLRSRDERDLPEKFCEGVPDYLASPHGEIVVPSAA